MNLTIWKFLYFFGYRKCPVCKSKVEDYYYDEDYVVCTDKQCRFNKGEQK